MLEYILETLGYEMHDNIIRKCHDELVRIISKPRTTEDYIIRIKKVLAKAS